MLVLPNMMIKLSNVRNKLYKIRVPPKCDKNMVTCETIMTVLLGIFVIYICQLLGNSVGLGWVGLTTPTCNVGST